MGDRVKKWGNVPGNITLEVGGCIMSNEETKTIAWRELAYNTGVEKTEERKVDVLCISMGSDNRPLLPVQSC